VSKRIVKLEYKAKQPGYPKPRELAGTWRYVHDSRDKLHGNPTVRVSVVGKEMIFSRPFCSPGLEDDSIELQGCELKGKFTCNEHASINMKCFDQRKNYYMSPKSSDVSVNGTVSSDGKKITLRFKAPYVNTTCGTSYRETLVTLTR